MCLGRSSPSSLEQELGRQVRKRMQKPRLWPTLGAAGGKGGRSCCDAYSNVRDASNSISRQFSFEVTCGSVLEFQVRRVTLRGISHRDSAKASRAAVENAIAARTERAPETFRLPNASSSRGCARPRKDHRVCFGPGKTGRIQSEIAEIKEKTVRIIVLERPRLRYWSRSGRGLLGGLPSVKGGVTLAAGIS